MIQTRTMLNKIKTAAILLVFYVAQFTAFAQDSAVITHGYFGVSFGPSMALGSYAKDQSSNDGYSSSGYDLKFDFLVRGNSNVGIYGQFGFFQNGLKSSIAENDSMTYIFAADKRANIFFMVGPAYTLSRKDIHIDFRTSVGFIHIADYAWKATYSSSSSYVNYVRYYYTDEKSETSSWKPGYSVGVNFRVNMGKKLQAMFGIDYMGSSYRQYSKSVLQYKSGKLYDQTQNYTSVTLSALQLSWGLAVSY